MKIEVVSYHLPHPDGTATGRHVFAIWSAARELGHDVSVWCWGQPPRDLEPPEWVRCSYFHDPGGWRRLPETLRRPRFGLASVGWQPTPGAFCWAEEPESYAAIAGARWRGVTVYHSPVLDAIALRQPHPAVVQSARAERYAVRKADVAITFSARVGRAVGIHNVLPVTLPIPAATIAPVRDPVAVMIADWAWPPNHAALSVLLTAWPAVCNDVPAARLLLAGRGLAITSAPDGVELVGEVDRAEDVLQRAAVLAFPCPPTSGPKMKVAEALAAGLPVVTTPAGIEALRLSPGAVTVAETAGFAAALADVLRDPVRRDEMAPRGRADILAHHTPQRAAAERLALIEKVSDRTRGGGAAMER